MLHRLISRPRLFPATEATLTQSAGYAVVACAVWTASPADGQTFTWIESLGGQWTDGSAWAGGVVPSGASDEAVFPDLGMPYDVIIDTSPTIASIHTASAGVHVALDAGDEMRLLAAGDLVHEGTLTINRQGFNSRTTLRVEGTSSLTGGGTILLNTPDELFPQSARLIVLGTSPVIGPGITITGDGEAVLAFTSFAGLIEASGDGNTVRVSGSPDFSPGGRARGVNGGRVRMGVSLAGGVMEGGVSLSGFTFGPGVTLFGENVAESISLTGTPALINNGDLVVNETAASISLSVSPRTGETASIEGSGRVVLNAPTVPSEFALLRVDDGEVLIIGPEQTVTGQGSLVGGGAVRLEGLLEADGPDNEITVSTTLNMAGTQGVVRGMNGGRVSLRFGAVLGGRLDGGVFNEHATLAGGVRLTGTNGQRVTGNRALGPGGVVNDGVFTIGDEGGTTQVILGLEDDSLINGDGELRFTAPAPGPLSDSQLAIAIGTTLTIGPEQTLTGSGDIRVSGDLVMHGTFDPGDDDAPGRIALLGPIEFSPTSRFRCDVFSGSSFDQLMRNSAEIDLDGTLELRLRDGYVPTLGERFRVLDAGVLTGGFAFVETPVVGGRLFRVDRSGGDIDVVWTCLADANGDGAVTPADFNAWIAAYNARSASCDQNGDGLCTPADFNAWILNFNAGC